MDSIVPVPQGVSHVLIRSSKHISGHVSHMEYIKDGINYMRMKFYIKGPSRSGTVHLEVREDSHKNYEYRYLFVDLDGHPKRTIILEDNRESKSSSNTFDVI